ncbi:MAG: Dabb family protein [Pseudomonadota bacterium]
MVLLSLRAGHDAAERDAIMRGLAELRLPGLLSFRHGLNIDVEGKSAEYPYGFSVTFTDRAALDTYLADATHRALGARLVALCRGGGSGIFVADLDIEAVE